MASEEYPLYYPSHPTALQELAYTKIALTLCNLHRLYPSPESDRAERWAEDMARCEEPLKRTLAPAIRLILMDRLRSLGEELNDTFAYFVQDPANIFQGSDKREAFMRCYDSFACAADGIVDAVETAKRLMTNNKLSLAEKYRIACVFFFEEDVLRLWPVMRNDRRFDKPSPGADPLVYYWTGVMKGGNRTQFPQNLLVVLKEMEPLRGTRSAFKYALSCGGVDDQLAIVDWIFHPERHFGRKSTEIPENRRTTPLTEEEWFFLYRAYVITPGAEVFLNVLTRVQADRVLSRCTKMIVMKLAGQEHLLEYAVRIWNLGQDFIGEEFAELLVELWGIAYQCPAPRVHDRILLENNKPVITCSRLAPFRAILTEIWINSSEDLQNQFLNENAELVERTFAILAFHDSYSLHRCYDHSPRFFLLILNAVPFERRNLIWWQFWQVVVIRCTPDKLRRFLTICLENEQEIQQFVRDRLLNYEHNKIYVDFMMNRQLYDKVTDLANLCSDADFARAFRRHVLNEVNERLPETLMRVNTLDPLFRLYQFIEGSFTESEATEANEWKQDVYFLMEFQQVLKNEVANGRIERVIQLTELCLNAESDLSEAKRGFAEIWKSYICDRGIIDRDDFARYKQFLNWCQVTGDRLSDFKTSIPADQVVEKLLLSVVQNLAVWLGPLDMPRREALPNVVGEQRQEFGLLDEFLSWRFASESDVQEYKTSKIHDYQNWPALQTLVTGDNECMVNDILRWFFSNDFVEIGRFKRNIQVLKVAMDCS